MLPAKAEQSKQIWWEDGGLNSILGISEKVEDTTRKSPVDVRPSGSCDSGV
jgi:hypothetical protein